VLSNLVHNIPLFPKYRFELRLAAYVCKVTDPAATIWPFIGFALLKFVGLMVIFILLRKKDTILKVVFTLFSYLIYLGLAWIWFGRI